MNERRPIKINSHPGDIVYACSFDLHKVVSYELTSIVIKKGKAIQYGLANGNWYYDVYPTESLAKEALREAVRKTYDEAMAKIGD